MEAAVPSESVIADVPAGDNLVKAAEAGLVNSCCQAWVEKYNKTKAGRLALKQGVQILEREHKEMQAESIRLKKAYDEELARADTERNNRVYLESRISEMDSEILYLKQLGQTDVQDRDDEIHHLKKEVSEREKEINQFKELYENEKIRANSEKKKAEANKKKADKASKSKANAAEEDKDKDLMLLKEKVSEGEKEINSLKVLYEKEKKRADSEKKKAEANKNKLCEALESKTSAVDEDRGEEILHLQERVSEGEKEINRLKVLFEKERKRADSEKKKAEANKKALCEALESKASAVEEDRGEEILHLQEQVSEREKEINCLKVLYEKEKKRADSEKKKAEANKKKLCEVLESKTSAVEEDRDEEVLHLEERVSEGEKEINHFKKLYEKEKRRADLEKKKAEANNKKAGKASKRKDNFVEESTMSMESEGPQDYMLQLEASQREVDDLKAKLAMENNKFEETIRKLEAEKKVAAEESKRADLELAKSEELRKVAEATSKKASEESSRSEKLNEQLEMLLRRIEELEKMIEADVEKEERLKELVSLENKISMLNSEIILVTQNGLLEVQKRDEEIKLLQTELSIKEKEMSHFKILYEREKDRAGSEKKNAQVLLKEFAEASMKELSEGKMHAENLSMQLEKARERIYELEMRSQKNSDLFSSRLEEAMMKISALQKQIEETSQCRKAGEVKEVNAKVAEIKFLKKQLKFEKKQVKHAKDVATLQKGRSCILQEELGHLRAEVVQILRRLDISARYCLDPAEDPNDFQKNDGFSNRRNFLENSYLLNSSQPYFQNENQLPVSGGMFTEPPSGIDSKLEPLVGGSNQKVLKSSAIHSSTASFSDRQLVGSQGRDTLTVTTSTQLGEENCPEKIMAGMSFDVANRCSTNLAAVADNTVNDCLAIDTGKRDNVLGQKRKRCVDAVESIENLCSEGKKLHLQVENKLSYLNGMINRKIEKQSEEKEHVKCYPRGGSYVNVDIQAKKVESSREMSYEDPSIVREASQSSDHPLKDMGHFGGAKLDHATDVSGTLVCFEDVGCGDYMKLLDLDNSSDEECYRVASQMPLSPTLPDISSQGIDSELPNAEIILKNSDVDEELNSQKENVAMSCVIESMVKSSGSDYLHDSLNHANDGAFVLPKNLQTSANDSCAIRSSKSLGSHARRSECVYRNVVLPGSSDEHRELSSDFKMISAASTPMSLVVSTDIMDNSSIYRIFCSTRRCLTEGALATVTELALPKILVSLRAEDITAKEKASAFFSLWLLNLTSFLTESCLKGDLRTGLISISRHINQVILNAETGNLFSELCSDELLTVMKKFLIDGGTMVYDASAREFTDSASLLSILVDGVSLNFSAVAASTEQLVAGSIVMASVCAAVGWIGSVCEVAYNILRMHRYKSFVFVTILHIFAFFGGETFLVSENCTLSSMVVKSIIMHLERESTSLETGCFFASVRNTNCHSCLLADCPFSKDTLPVDNATLSLLEKLENFFKLGITCSGVTESTHNSSVLLQMHKGDASSTTEGPSKFLCMACDKSCCLLKQRVGDKQSETAVAVTFCDISDVLSLLELIAFNMSWDWTYNRIILQLLKMLELPLEGDHIVAIVTLVGHLGRFGVDAVGCEDERVKCLISQLSALLRRERSAYLSVQTTILAALLSICNLKFEKVIQSDFKLSGTADEFIPVDEIRNWYHLLKKEPQEQFTLLLHSLGL